MPLLFKMMKFFFEMEYFLLVFCFFWGEIYILRLDLENMSIVAFYFLDLCKYCSPYCTVDYCVCNSLLDVLVP